MTRWINFIRRATVLSIVLAIGLAVVLLPIKHKVQRLEEELVRVNDAITKERQSIKILQAEFSLLTEPDRLRRLASRYLSLVPVEPAQLGTFASLDQPASTLRSGDTNATRHAAKMPASAVHTAAMTERR